ncbi:2844_t:CDS:2 [Ambispora gerdemannii]|uniref:2844_t:CDS:1 n=1 Tax=Ambispora gerdemannii TaxID=144530 RepID=A0A9N9F484_9GLOM|nr:2844_t:CDS:2 [Ambispora gerdemannii]
MSLKSSFIIDNTDGESLLYDDIFFSATTKHLIIKKYYFPIGTSKYIPLTEITSVVTDQEYPLRWWQVKPNLIGPITIEDKFSSHVEQKKSSLHLKGLCAEDNDNNEKDKNEEKEA